MSHLINNEQKLTEIVFANRNKNYGAYVIRSTYGETVLKALLMTAGLVTAAFATGYLLSDHADTLRVENTQITDSIYTIPVNLEPEKPVEETSAKKPVTASAETSSEITKPVVSDTLETVAENNLNTPETGTTGSETGEGEPQPETGHGGGSDGTGVVTATVSQIRSIIHVQKLPEFEGGLSALYRFIAANTRFTEEALDANQGGKIYVQFVVDEEGKISSITLLNKLGFGLDEEALRVVGLIPKFKTPAMVDGQPVKMYYQLPINFKIR